MMNEKEEVFVTTVDESIFDKKIKDSVTGIEGTCTGYASYLVYAGDSTIKRNRYTLCLEFTVQGHHYTEWFNSDRCLYSST